MKKIILSIVGLSMIFTSCDKSLLDIPNPNNPTVDTYWNTPVEAEKGLISVYNMLYRGPYVGDIYIKNDLTSDEGYGGGSDYGLNESVAFRYNYGIGSGLWSESYKMIFRANQVLTLVPEIDFDNEEQKKLILAQARFFRALAHWNLAIAFETAPIVTKVSSVTDKPSSSTVEEMFAFCETEFALAAEDLPIDWGIDVARPTKGAALAMLAKVQMQQAGQIDGMETKWSEAKTTLDIFISGTLAGKYELVADYYNNFKHTSENNNESIFEIQFSDINKGGGSGDVLKPNLASGRAMSFAPRSVGGFGNGVARPWLLNAFRNETGDKRLRATLFYKEKGVDFPDDYQVYGNDWDDNAWGDKVFVRKHQRDYYRNDEDLFSENNLRLIRYADILLMYAEVLNEVEGNPANAVKYINMVRERAGLGTLEASNARSTQMENAVMDYDYKDAATNSTLFKRHLKLERSLELCFETWRWSDLKRWDDLKQENITEIKFRDADFNGFVPGKNERLPIALEEVANNPNLEQNIGY